MLSRSTDGRGGVGAGSPQRALASALHRIAVQPRTAQLLEGAGFHTLADHADRIRSDRDVAAIPLPTNRHSLRRQRVKLLRRDGADKATGAMADRGWNGYEAPLPDVLVRFVRSRRGAFFDVGANTGLYALLAAAARRDLLVHAFEAFPAVAAMLEQNLGLNRCGARIRVNPLAVSDRIGRSQLHVPVPTVGAVETSASLDIEFKGGGGTALGVDTTTLDAYWLQAGRPPVGVIKIDTEGTEHLVLGGAGELVDRTRPIIFYEFLPRGAGTVLDEWASDHSMVDVRLSEVEAVVGERVRFDELAWNHAFVPAEGLEPSLALFGEAGLVVTRLR